MIGSLLDTICRHQSSFFFFHFFEKELRTNFTLLTKIYQFLVVQSTTTGTTTCTPCHCFHTVTYSLPVVPIRKLLQYSHGQGCGDTHSHLVGSHPQNHRIAPFYVSACILCMTPICLVCLFSCAALSCTMYSLHSVPQFSILLCCTLRPSLHKCHTSMHNSRTMQLLTLNILHQWQSNVPP